MCTPDPAMQDKVVFTLPLKKKKINFPQNIFRLKKKKINFPQNIFRCLWNYCICIIIPVNSSESMKPWIVHWSHSSGWTWFTASACYS